MREGGKYVFDKMKKTLKFGLDQLVFISLQICKSFICSNTYHIFFTSQKLPYKSLTHSSLFRAFSKVINELSRLSKGVCEDVVHFEDNLADLHNKSFSTAHFFTSEGNLTGR